MKHNNFNFPGFLPNDLEGLMFVYPRKFPQIVNYYEESVKKFFNDPIGFKDFTEKSYSDLRKGFEKIKNDYDSKKKKDLHFLLEIDKRLHKLYAFRFWVINYLFADGPLHEYYVDTIKSACNDLFDQGEDIDQYENKVLSAQRDLLQSDYADLYLQNALNGVEFMELAREDSELSNLLDELSREMKNANASNKDLYKKMDPLIDSLYKKENDLCVKLYNLLKIPIVQADFRKTRDPVYHMITHSIEFEDENMKLKKRYQGMRGRIDELFDLAKDRFPDDKFLEFKNSYEMAKNLSVSKDTLGNIDPILLPFWLNLLQNEVPSCLKDSPDFLQIGIGGLFYELVWRLPDEYKAEIFSVDPTPFSLEGL